MNTLELLHDTLGFDPRELDDSYDLSESFTDEAPTPGLVPEDDEGHHLRRYECPMCGGRLLDGCPHTGEPHPEKGVCCDCGHEQAVVGMEPEQESYEVPENELHGLLQKLLSNFGFGGRVNVQEDFSGTGIDAHGHRWINHHQVSRDEWEQFTETGKAPAHIAQAVPPANALQAGEVAVAAAVPGKVDKRRRVQTEPVLPEAEWHKLVTDYQNLAFKEANRWAKTYGDVDDAADVAQSALVDAARTYDPARIHKGSGKPYTFAGWAKFRIKNSLKNQVARNYNVKAGSLTGGEKDIDPVDYRGDETATKRNELLDLIGKTLDPRERAIVLGVIDKKPSHVIAAELGGTVSAARVRQIRDDAFSKLKQAASAYESREVLESHDYATTQFSLDDGRLLADLRAMAYSIDQEDLHTKGRSVDFHITAVFGLECCDPDAVRNVPGLTDFGPVKCKLGCTAVFQPEGKDYDVVVILVQDCPRLQLLHTMIKDFLPNEQTYPKYNPHLTLAFCKKGLGVKYDGMLDLDGVEVELCDLVFSDKEDRRTKISLCGGDSLESLALELGLSTEQVVMLESACDAVEVSLLEDETKIITEKQREALTWLKKHWDAIICEEDPDGDEKLYLTGLHTSILTRLKMGGFISGRVFLGGKVLDLEITAKGKAEKDAEPAEVSEEVPA